MSDSLVAGDRPELVALVGDPWHLATVMSLGLHAAVVACIAGLASPTGVDTGVKVDAIAVEFVEAASVQGTASQDAVSQGGTPEDVGAPAEIAAVQTETPPPDEAPSVTDDPSPPVGEAPPVSSPASPDALPAVEAVPEKPETPVPSDSPPDGGAAQRSPVVVEPVAATEPAPLDEAPKESEPVLAAVAPAAPDIEPPPADDVPADRSPETTAGDLASPPAAPPSVTPPPAVMSPVELARAEPPPTVSRPAPQRKVAAPVAAETPAKAKPSARPKRTEPPKLNAKAAPEVAQRSGSAGGAHAPSAGRPEDLAAYLASIRARITAQRPRSLGADRGRVEIRFSIAADGRLGDVKVVRSDDDALEEEAIKIVRRTSPVPPIPPASGQTSLTMAVTVEFR